MAIIGNGRIRRGGRLLPVFGVSAVALPAFVYETETNTLVSALTTAGATVSAGRKYMMNRWIKKWKADGTWAALTQLWIHNAVDGASLVNWKTPGTLNLTKISTPTFTDPTVPVGGALSTVAGYSAFSTTAYIDSNIALNTINQNSFCWGEYHVTTSTTAVRSMGALDGVNGLSIQPRTGTTASVRAMGAETAGIGVAADHNSQGLHCVQRTSSSSIDYFHNVTKFAGIASTSVASVSANTVTFGNCRGASSVLGGGLYGGFYCNTALTDAQQDSLYRGMTSLIEAVQYRDMVINEAGYAPATVSAEIIVYGWTFQGAMAVSEALLQGHTVAWVGGWDDHTPTDFGGVSANGLGYGDIDNTAALGFRVGALLDRIAAAGLAQGTTAALKTKFIPKGMNLILGQLLDPARNGGLTPAIYESGGVVSVSKTGTVINSITCADGRTYSGQIFLDCSYEMDVGAVAGLSYVTGYEAAGTSLEAAGGYRGGKANVAFGSGTNHQAKAGATYLNIDPYITPGVSASGLIANAIAAPSLTVGQAGTTTQAFAYRQTWSSTQANQKRFATTPRTGYQASDWEALGRVFSAAAAIPATIATSDIMAIRGVALNIADINSGGLLSNDVLNSGNLFAAAGQNYATRRAIKQTMFNWVQDWNYYLTYDPDSRIAGTSARTAILGYGYSANHYLDPGPNDVAYQASKIYVREFRRPVGDLVWDANDLGAANGTTPRSTKTVTAVSYTADSHSHGMIADNSSGTMLLWNSNEIFEVVDGANLISPGPREIFLPKQAECTNLAYGWAASCTHVAEGAIRMEFTTAQGSQSMALLGCIAIETATTMAAVSDATFRARQAAIDGGTTNTYLPQTN